MFGSRRLAQPRQVGLDDEPAQAQWRSKVIKKTLAGVATLALATLALSACSPSGSGDEAGAAETITVWSWRVEDAAAYETIFDVFEEQNPGITVEFKGFKNTEYNQILATGLTGSGGPDVAQLKSYGGLQGYVDGGQLLSLDDSIEGLSSIPQASLDGLTGKTDGQIYGVPFATQTLQVFYNTEIFEENGLEEPSTWDELLETSAALQAAGLTAIAVGGADAQVQTPIAADVFGTSRYGGAEFYNAVETGEKDFTDPDYVAALELMQEIQPYLSENVVATSYNDAQVQFISGQAGMFVGGSWELGFFQAQNPDLKIGVFPVPVGTDWASSTALTPGFVDGGWGISSATTHQEAAEKLLEWMTTVEFGQLFADNLHQMSTIPGVELSDPVQQEMADNYAANGSPYMMLVGFRYGQPWGTDLVGTGVQSLWLGEKDAATVAGDIQAGIDTWFTPQP
jgi:raffinose/stachyose/melibiose transport system substrate-binding protein